MYLCRCSLFFTMSMAVKMKMDSKSVERYYSMLELSSDLKYDKLCSSHAFL